MTTSQQQFEKEILENQAQIKEIIRHKVKSHQDPFTVHLSYPGSTEIKVFEDIGHILLMKSLQITGQLEEFASALFSNDLHQFLSNGYQIRE